MCFGTLKLALTTSELGFWTYQSLNLSRVGTTNCHRPSCTLSEFELSSTLARLTTDPHSVTFVCSQWVWILVNSRSRFSTKAAFIRQTNVGQLELANSNWSVCKRHNNMWANYWRQIELVSILHDVSQVVVVSFTHTNCRPTRVGQHLFVAVKAA